MANSFNILAWRIPWAEEPSGLQSTGSHRVGHDLALGTGMAPDLLLFPLPGWLFLSLFAELAHSLSPGTCFKWLLLTEGFLYCLRK